MATKRLFSDWNKEELEATFGLTRLFQSPLIDQWFERAASQDIRAFEQEMLANLRQTLFENADAWNEMELTEYFIGPILAIVNFHTPHFNIFSDRAITATVGEYELYGEPDAVIAKGRYSPQIPYFCFHEYKRAHEPKGDPAAQALAAMLAARELNPHPHPIYGMYVVSEAWHFMILNGNEYCISNSYVASQEDHLLMIVKALKALKIMLLEIAKRDA